MEPAATGGSRVRFRSDAVRSIAFAACSLFLSLGAAVMPRRWSPRASSTPLTTALVALKSPSKPAVPQNHHHPRPYIQLNTNHPSNISASSPRISSIANVSRRMCSCSSSWFAVAFTLISANLLGNRMDVSSQERAE